MRVFRHLSEAPRGVYRVVAFGAFDGFHLGHRRLLSELCRRSGNAGLVIVDEREIPFLRLSSRRRCLEECRTRGVAAALIVRARDAEPAALIRSLGVRSVIAGAGESVPTSLRSDGSLEEIPPVSVGGEPITASRLRAAVVGGELGAAATMLGAPYPVEGRVVHGFHRGATIGVPTANLRVRGWQLPPDGVYAVTASTGGFVGSGVANLGTNPTFGGGVRSLETNIFDFVGDLYGARLAVGFVARLRGERKFENVDELVSQIRRDITAARRIHARHG